MSRKLSAIALAVATLNPAGLSMYGYNDYGRTPKEYGQYLQANKKQKWVKSKKK